MSSGIAETRVATHGRALALRFEEHVGEPVPVAVAGDATRQNEDVGGAQACEQLGTGERPGPLDPIRDAGFCGELAKTPDERTAADVDEAPAKLRRQPGKRRDEVGIPLLLDRAADGDDGERGPSFLGCTGGRRRELGEVEPVPHELHLARREPVELDVIDRGAGHHPLRVPELLALLPPRRRPDVLGVGGARPLEARKVRRVARDRRGGVEEMGVDVGDLPGQLVRHDERLAEAAHAVARRVAREVAKPQPKHRAVAGPAPHRAPGPKDPRRFVMQVLRKVRHRRPDPRVDRVHARLRRMAERDDGEPQPPFLEGHDLLGDEGLREARIALENEHDGRRRCSSPHRSPTFVARASRRRGGGPHGPKERMRAAEGVVDTTSKRLEGVRPVTAHGSASAAGSW